MADEKTTKTAVRNVSPGVRGLNTVSGYRDFERNEYAESVELTAAELTSAKRTGYFRFGTAAKADPNEEAGEPVERLENPTEQVAPGTGAGGSTFAASGGGSTDELDKMDDATLRTTTSALTGKPEAELSDLDRDALLKLARGE